MVNYQTLAYSQKNNKKKTNEWTFEKQKVVTGVWLQKFDFMMRIYRGTALYNQILEFM